MKHYYLKIAQKEDEKVLIKTLKNGTKVYKHPGKSVYLLEERGNFWLLARSGAVNFKSKREAFDAFFGVKKVGEFMNFVRKSSIAAVNKEVSLKKASFNKTAICYDNDAWISDPKDLSNVYTRDYWAITNTGKHIARLFDEKDFPLKG